jgi:translation initiation factor 4E
MDPEYSHKHALESRWTFWFEEPAQYTPHAATEWESNAQPVYAVDTVEDFWAVHDNIPTPSKLSAGCTYYLMKNDIRPQWEDPSNIEGGRWVLQLDKRSSEESDTLWLNACLACIGEQVQPSDLVTGCVVQVRAKGNRVQLWLSVADPEEVVCEMGRKFKAILESPESAKLNFSLHNNGQSGSSKTLSGMSKAKKASKREELYTV